MKGIMQTRFSLSSQLTTRRWMQLERMRAHLHDKSQSLSASAPESDPGGLDPAEQRCVRSDWAAYHAHSASLSAAVVEIGYDLLKASQALPELQVSACTH